MDKSIRRVKNISAIYLLPSIIGVALFFVLPFLVVIYYSMIDNPISGEFVFLENFHSLLTNKAFKMAAGNSLTFSFVAVPLVIVLSLGVAFLLDKNIPGKSRIRTAFLSPMMVPVASVILIWQVLFHYNGLVNEFFLSLGGDKIDWLKSEMGQIVVVLLFLWKNLGYNMILFLAALNNIQVHSGMNLASVKQRIGDRVAIVGNVDATGIMCASDQAPIAEAIRQVVETAGQDGGLIIATDHSFHKGIPQENVLYFLEKAKEIGSF